MTPILRVKEFVVEMLKKPGITCVKKAGDP